jgi:hypothetical protein
MISEPIRAHARRTVVDHAEPALTPPWREMDSNLRFRVRSEYGRGRRLAHHLGWMWIPFPELQR